MNTVPLDDTTLTTEFIPSGKPDITITITPNQETWCAKEITFVPETPAVSFTSGRGMQVCLSCYEEVHGELERDVHKEINSMMITANIQYYAAKTLYWKGKRAAGR